VSLKTLFGWGAFAQAAAPLPILALSVPDAARAIFVAHDALSAITPPVTNVAEAAYLASTAAPTSLGRAAAASQAVTMG